MILKSCRDISTISESCRGFVRSHACFLHVQKGCILYACTLWWRRWLNKLLSLCVSFDSPHPLFRIVSRAHRSRFHDLVVPEVEAPSIQQDVLLQKRDAPSSKGRIVRWSWGGGVQENVVGRRRHSGKGCSLKHVQLNKALNKYVNV